MNETSELLPNHMHVCSMRNSNEHSHAYTRTHSLTLAHTHSFRVSLYTEQPIQLEEAKMSVPIFHIFPRQAF